MPLIDVLEQDIHEVKCKTGTSVSLVCHIRRPNETVIKKKKNKESEVLCHSRCDTVNITPCSRTINGEQRVKVNSFVLTMVMSPFEDFFFRADVKRFTINQLINKKIIILSWSSFIPATTAEVNDI